MSTLPQRSTKYHQMKNHMPEFMWIIFQKSTEQFTKWLIISGSVLRQLFTQPQCSHINANVEFHLHAHHVITEYSLYDSKLHSTQSIQQPSEEQCLLVFESLKIAIILKF